MTDYFRPLCQTGPIRPEGALALAGGWAWCTHVEHLRRGHLPAVIPAAEVPAEVALALWTPRAPILGMTLDRPRLMGIVNVTPDSFSDGGQFHDREAAVAHAMAMAGQGADILDIGGESTRPGSDTVETEDEIARVVPVIAALSAAGAPPVSIDTRKAAVARAALDAGAGLVNDVAAFTHDPALAPLAAERRVPVCLMHAKGDPKTMQDDPRYDDVLLDVYDFLAERVAMAEAAGIPRAQVVVDPGIGFGKTVAHNLALLRGLSLFHGLGCPILLGASRKRFIGTLGHAPNPADRAPGSIAVALAAVQQGVQICRVHDMEQTKQAVRLFSAATHIGTAE
ncbi:MAG: dihydropteroate synthase [Paracoccaceae bacterium]